MKKHSAVVVVPYSAEWPREFELVAGLLASVFAGAGVELEHIGSTAVAGLAAKPIVDILAGATSLEVYEARQSELGAIGFERVDKYDAQMPQRRYFVRDGTRELMRVNLHAVVIASRFWREHVAFRDALRRNPLLAGRYAKLKFELAERFRFDRPAYTAAKQPFIEAVLREEAHES